MALSLPDDLYREIIKHVASRHDLYSLALCNRALQNDAEYFMYRHVESSQWPRTEDLCQLLIRSSRLSPLVRSLSITHQGLKFPPSPEYWGNIAQLLASLPNLEILKIYNGLSMANNNAWVLDNCVASLHKVEFDFEFDKHLLNFLTNQALLEQIHWINSSREDVSPAILQSLETSLAFSSGNLLPTVKEVMTNCSPFALHLVNANHLTHLWISGSPSPRIEDGGVQLISQFDSNATSLRSLRLNFPVRRRNCAAMLTELALHVPHLRSLGFLPYFDTSDRDIFDALAAFKHLESVVTGSVISAETSRLLAQACSTLRLVACLHYSYSHEYVFLPVNPLGTPKPVHDPDLLLWRDA